MSISKHKYKIAVICHDAGASELLCALITKHLERASWVLFAKEGSPFAKIALQKGLKTLSKIDLTGIDALFFGTGWEEKIERPHVKKAKENNIPTFAFLDHWSFYKERFGYPAKGWQENLPDFTVVSDKKAEMIANNHSFPHPARINNFYLQNQLDQFLNKGFTTTDNLLFLSEPTDKVALATYGNKDYWGFTQYSALENILKEFEKFQCAGLHIRLHPSEKEHAYNKVLKKYPHIKFQIYPSDFFPIEKDLLRSKMIIGFDTMALYTAALLHKPVISYLPSTNREFLLPLPTSHQLRTLNDIRPIHLKALDLKLDSDGIGFAFILELIERFDI